MIFFQMSAQSNIQYILTRAWFAIKKENENYFRLLRRCGGSLKYPEGRTISPPTFILETASSACIILVALVGCPSHTSWVEPRYRARKRTPSISTFGSVTGPEGRSCCILMEDRRHWEDCGLVGENNKTQLKWIAIITKTKTDEIKF